MVSLTHRCCFLCFLCLRLKVLAKARNPHSKAPVCSDREFEFVRYEELLYGEIAEGDQENFLIDILHHEEVLINIRAGVGGRLPRRLRPEVNDTIPPISEENLMVTGRSDGGDSQVLEVYSREDWEVISTFGDDDDDEAEDEEAGTMLWYKGQRGDCHDSIPLQVSGLEGSGNVAVTAEYFRRNGWNNAAVTFENAIDIGSFNDLREWCGNVNWFSDESACGNTETTPKWKVWLNENDELVVNAHLLGNEKVKIYLKLYSDNKGENLVKEVLKARADGTKGKVKEGAFVHASSTPSWFYLELYREGGHLREYGITFEVNRACTDHDEKDFVLPRDEKTCEWLLQTQQQGEDESARFEALALCHSSDSNAKVACPRTCGVCGSDSPTCEEDSGRSFYRRKCNCKHLHKLTSNRRRWPERLDHVCRVTKAGEICPETCGKCPSPVGPTE